MDMKEDTLEIGKMLVSTLFSKFCKITNNLIIPCSLREYMLANDKLTELK
jgi:hypothetical protein